LAANTGSLFVYGTAGSGDLGLGTMVGTSPSITARGGGYEILFQSNTGELWRTSGASSTSLGLGMAPSSSPAAR
jgi:hypothetical protein